MRTHSTLAMAALAAALALVLLVGSGRSATPVRAAGGGCPASFFVGLYGFTGSGFTTGVHGASLPTASGGELIVSPDPAPALLTGTISGNMTVNDGRSVSRLAVNGTYTMNAGECRGSATLNASSGATLHYDLVLTQWINGPAQEVFFVRTDARDPETLTLSNA